jgi:hypothetical protein
MGCDYYITKELHIYYGNGKYDFISITLEEEKGYFYYPNHIDEDEDGYDEMINNYKKQELTPNMKPIIIYENGYFVKKLFKEKYEQLIENEINRNCKLKTDIINIIKIEDRYERN